jgi:hypothetical protein
MEDNKPVCLLEKPASDWLVCFVPPIEKQWWHWMLRSRFKHCFALKHEGPDCWVLFEPWWSRILIAKLNNDEAQAFIDWGKKGIILKVKEHKPGRSSQWRGWMSCAALVAHVLGRPCWVYTPAQLLKKLLREPENHHLVELWAHRYGI